MEHFLLLYSNESKGLPWCSSPFLTIAALGCLVTHLRNSWRSGSIFDVEYKSDRKKCFHYLNSWKHFSRSKVVCLVPNFREQPTRLLQSSHLYCVLEETSNRHPCIKIPENIYMCLSRTAIEITTIFKNWYFTSADIKESFQSVCHWFHLHVFRKNNFDQNIFWKQLKHDIDFSFTFFSSFLHLSFVCFFP